MKPRFAIELDDKSHNRQERMERDEFVEELFETAHLPLVRIPVRPAYNTHELGVLFREALAEKPKAPTGQPFTVPVGETSLAELVEAKTPVGSSSVGLTSVGLTSVGLTSVGEPVEPPDLPSTGAGSGQAPFCPKCGQRMVLRTAENGANKGKRFWGCVNYPKCRMAVPV